MKARIKKEKNQKMSFEKFYKKKRFLTLYQNLIFKQCSELQGELFISLLISILVHQHTVITKASPKQENQRKRDNQDNTKTNGTTTSMQNS